METKERTSVKSEIKRAFMQLLLQKAYTDITVSDLVNKAEVARMSFYRNFRSTDDVIESIANDMIQGFKTEIAPVLQSKDERKWREWVFEMIYRLKQGEKEFGIPFREVSKMRANHGVVISRIQEKILLQEDTFSDKTAAEKYTIVGKLNLIHGILSKWALSGMQETPEELVNVIMSMISKF